MLVLRKMKNIHSFKNLTKNMNIQYNQLEAY